MASAVTKICNLIRTGGEESEIIRELDKMDPKYVNEPTHNTTLLKEAVEYAMVLTVEKLLQMNADPSETLKGESPLFRACLNGESGWDDMPQKIKICKMLLDTGKADIGYQVPESGETAFIAACESGFSELAQLLLEYDNEKKYLLLDNDGRDGFYYAYRNDCRDIMVSILYKSIGENWRS